MAAQIVEWVGYAFSGIAMAVAAAMFVAQLRERRRGGGG